MRGPILPGRRLWRLTIPVEVCERSGSRSSASCAVAELHDGPARLVVHPLVGKYLVPGDADGSHHVVEVFICEFSSAAGWRNGEGQDARAAAHLDKTSRALLYDSVAQVRVPAVFESDVGSAEGRVAGEREFAARRKNAHPVVRLGTWATSAARSRGTNSTPSSSASTKSSAVTLWGPEAGRINHATRDAPLPARSILEWTTARHSHDPVSDASVTKQYVGNRRDPGCRSHPPRRAPKCRRRYGGPPRRVRQVLVWPHIHGSPTRVQTMRK